MFVCLGSLILGCPRPRSDLLLNEDGTNGVISTIRLIEVIFLKWWSHFFIYICTTSKCHICHWIEVVFCKWSHILIFGQEGPFRCKISLFLFPTLFCSSIFQYSPFVFFAFCGSNLYFHPTIPFVGFSWAEPILLNSIVQDHIVSIHWCRA